VSFVRSSVLGLSIVALGACASAPPQDQRGPGGPGGPGGPQLTESMIARPLALLFSGFDTDRDFATSSEEFAAGLKTEFTRADANGDGFISAFEMIDWSTKVMGDKEAQPDYRTMNSDLGRAVTPGEFEIALRREFTRMDRDGDGKLLRAEMLTPAPRMGMGGAGGEGGMVRRQGGGRGGPGGGSGGRPPG
jgi:Ca2+-binding EF-hand superfamily protein